MQNAFYSFSILAVIHVGLKIIPERQISKKIKEKRTRYSFRKIISILYIASTVVAMVAIWSEGTQEIAVAGGLVTAGVAFALQDLL